MVRRKAHVVCRTPSPPPVVDLVEKESDVDSEVSMVDLADDSEISFNFARNKWQDIKTEPQEEEEERIKEISQAARSIR